MNILLSCLVAFLLCLLIFPDLIRLLVKLKAIDSGGGRKIHKGSTPTMGGIGILLATVIAFVIFCQDMSMAADSKYVFGAIFIMFLLGLTDDALDVRARRKLLVQIVTGTMVYLAGIKINTLFGFFGIYDIPEWSAYVVTVFTIIVVTNSYNLIDGINGLAASVGVSSFLFLAIWFYLTNDTVFALYYATLIGSLIGFLRYNWTPARIFMGDSGSLFIGFSLAVGVIKFMNANYTLGAADPFYFQGTVGCAVALVMYPMYDTLRVFIMRIKEGRSPLSADTNHTHHYLLRMSYSHTKSTLIIVISNIVITGIFIFISYFIKGYYTVPAILILSLLLHLRLKHIDLHHKAA